MKRIIDQYLEKWKDDPLRQPLLLHGARQVGKTFAARKLGETFPDFVELNLELLKDAPKVFDGDLDPQTLISIISALAKKPIIPGKTLLFIDEIQTAPRAIQSLRYFYEMMPELHVIAAGSLLDFALNKYGAPVGRVQSLYMYPLSFLEFLSAVDEAILIEKILSTTLEQRINPIIHDKILNLLGHYMALGGMPHVVNCWQQTRDPVSCADLHERILAFYRQDFGKYGRSHQIKYVDALFETVPHLTGSKFKYSAVEGEYRKRELAPALELLSTASVVQKIYRTSAQGVPLGAQAFLDDYKVFLLDVGLTQSALNQELGDWFLNPTSQLINKGPLTESFVGQEILAYSNPSIKKQLYYWKNDEPQSKAEVDFVIQQGSNIIPIEVKAGTGSTLRSLHLFLSTHPNSPYGIRFSTQNYSLHEKLRSYPLYAVAYALATHETEKNILQKALLG